MRAATEALLSPSVYRRIGLGVDMAEKRALTRDEADQVWLEVRSLAHQPYCRQDDRA